MKKTFLYTATALLAFGSLSSCMPEGTTEVTVPIEYDQTELIMGYSTNDGNTVLQTTAPKTTIVRSLQANTLSFKFSYLIDPLSFSTTTLTTEPLSYQTTNNKLVINLPSLTMAGGQTVQNFSFTGFYNWMSIKFIYNGVQYFINTKATLNMQVVPGTPNVKMVLFDGSTLVSNTPFDEGGFSTNDTQYGIEFKDNGVAQLYMLNAQFASMMPQLQILIPDLSYRMTADSYVITSNASITPFNVTASGNDLYPQYVITDFSATIPYVGSNGSLQFNCTSANWNVAVSDLSITPVTIAEGGTNDF